jgi:hypothetical protein
LLKNSTSETETIDRAELFRARVIVNEAADLADQVLAGAMYFKTAFEEASRRRAEREQAEAHMKRLHDEAPDLATMVLEEKGMTASEAIGALETRRRKADEAKAERRAEREHAAEDGRCIACRTTARGAASPLAAVIGLSPALNAPAAFLRAA